MGIEHFGKAASDGPCDTGRLITSIRCNSSSFPMPSEVNEDMLFAVVTDSGAKSATGMRMAVGAGQMRAGVALAGLSLFMALRSRPEKLRAPYTLLFGDEVGLWSGLGLVEVERHHDVPPCSLAP